MTTPEKVISTTHKYNEVTNDWYVEVIISGLSTQEQAIKAIEHVHKLMCGEEIIPS